MDFDDNINISLGLGLGLVHDQERQKKKEENPCKYPLPYMIKRERDEDHQPEAFVEDDENNNSSSARNRKKLRLTKQQSVILEDTFKHHSTLNPKQKQELANNLNLRMRQVEVWFQNRRARTKLKQSEIECEEVKKCYEILREEKKKLEEELKELKYMKTICPSCKRLYTGTTGGDSNKNNIGPSHTTALILGPKAQSHLCTDNTNDKYIFTQSSATMAS